MITAFEAALAYRDPIVGKLRELLGDIYTPEEFGMYLALSNHVLWDGKSVLELIYEGRGEEAVRVAQQLADCVYI